MKKIIGSMIITLIFFSISALAQNLKIGDVSLKGNGEAELISLKRDGKVTVSGNLLGILSVDGKLKDLTGKMIAEIDKQGKVTDNDRKVIGIVNKNGEIDNGSGKKIGWTKDGKFNISEKDFLTIAPNEKKFYQTTAFLVLLYFSAKESKTGFSIETKTPIQD